MRESNGESGRKSRETTIATWVLPLLTWLVFPVPVMAADITVSGECSLLEALENADDTATGQPHADCAAGNAAGADTVILTGDVVLTEAHAYTQGKGLPPLTSEVTVEGNGFSISRSHYLRFNLFNVDSGADVTLKNVILTGGDRRDHGIGGAIRNVGGTLALSNVAVVGNMAKHGGGIFNSGAATLTDVTISDNHTSTLFGGGGFYNHDGTATLRNVTFSANSTVGSGGGIYIEGGSVTCTNCTFSGNAAVEAADIANNGTFSLVQSTLAGNASGLWAMVGFYLHPIDVTGSILASSLPNCHSPFSINDLGGNVVRDGDLSCSETMAFLAEGLDPVLRDNGGPTLTHALLEEYPDSQAVDWAGNCGLATDQRGAPRPLGYCDAGAYEQLWCGDLRFFNEIAPGTYEYCGDIIVSATIWESSVVTLRSGTRIIFWNGTDILEHVELTVGTDSDLQTVPP